jgi:hypothetical protein
LPRQRGVQRRLADGSLCGFDTNNRGSPVSPAVGKRLACSTDSDGNERIVIAEGFIDMLSPAASFPDERTGYRAFPGVGTGRSLALTR